MESVGNLLKYKYHDTPDGEDVFKKLFVSTKYATIAGLTAGTLDVMLMSKPKGYLPAIGRYIHFTGAYVAMAATFTATSHMLTVIRKKDDELNYILGAMSSGLLFGAMRKNMVIGTWTGIILSCVAAAQKTAVLHNTSLFSFPKAPVTGNVWHYKTDYSWTPDNYPKGYVIKKPE